MKNTHGEYPMGRVAKAAYRSAKRRTLFRPHAEEHRSAARALLRACPRASGGRDGTGAGLFDIVRTEMQRSAGCRPLLAPAGRLELAVQARGEERDRAAVGI